MIHQADWATSRNRKPIEIYSSDVVSKMHHPLLWIGGVHGDEPEGVELAERTLDFLKKEKVSVPWILIPCLNVDGFSSRTRTNGGGVDLNRNFASRDWSPNFEKDRYHPGPTPGSEPETTALMKLIEQANPRLIVHCHSWNPCIVCAGPEGMIDASRLGTASGYGVREDIGYPTPGSLSSYGFFDHGIPVICIEEQEGVELSQVWPHFEPGVRDIFFDPSLRRATLKP